MKKFSISAIALAVGLVFGTGAMAQSVSKDEYKVRNDRIEADFKSERAACDAFVANSKDVCRAQAKGKENIAKAELEASYKPSQKAHYDARVAKAEADFSVARQKCDDKAGNPRDVCVKEAKAAETAAKADAKVRMKTVEANAAANAQSAEARVKASDKSADARKDAASDKRDAEYAVAHAKCDAFASDTKDRCIVEAKARYGKS
jgi:hypothetical protein